jgi:hypothetical protein
MSDALFAKALEYHRNGDPWRDVLCGDDVGRLLEHADQLAAENARLREALEALIRGYVNTLESAFDRIKFLGGDCDPVDVMERNDPHLRAAKAALAKKENERG